MFQFGVKTGKAVLNTLEYFLVQRKDGIVKFFNGGFAVKDSAVEIGEGLNHFEPFIRALFDVAGGERSGKLVNKGVFFLFEQAKLLFRLSGLRGVEGFADGQPGFL